MNELISEQQTIKSRYWSRSIWVTVVVIIGLLAVAGSVVMLSIVSLDQRLARLEEQENAVATTETLSTVQSEIQVLRTGLEDNRKGLATVQEQVTSQPGSNEEIGEIVSLRQAFSALQKTQQEQESRFDVLMDQFNAMEKKSAAADTETKKETKKSVPVKSRSSVRARSTVRNAPFVLTGVEKRGADFWAAVAPHGYNTLAQITLIGEGETVSGWTLVSTGDSEATFRVNGKGRLTILKME